MGVYFTDVYSLLHLAVGILFYFFGVSFVKSVLVHVAFEYIENMPEVMRVTNASGVWPGGKPSADTLTNTMGDTFYFSLGWIVAYMLDQHYFDDDAKYQRGSCV